MTLRSALSLLGVLIFLSGGCATTDEGDAEVTALLDDWVGMSDRTLVLKWGAPDSVYQMQDGTRILTWRRSRTENRGGELSTVAETRIVDGEKVVVPITHQTPIITWRYECVTSFEVDSDGYVIGHPAVGNDCASQPPPD